jgi:glutamyl-tRNA reductase
LPVVVVGLEHRQAPLDLLERVTVPESDVGKVLGALRDRANLEESALLSTCLRTEVYAVVDRFHDAVHEVQELLATMAGVSAAELEVHLSVRFDDDVPAHLFAVASGLESAVPGESEILGQVRRAFERADEEKVSGPVLGELFQHAIRTGRRVRSETGIARGTTSFSHAAVEVAESSRAGGLSGATVVVVGAGEMGTGVARALLGLPEERRPAELVVANRTAGRADALRRAIGPVGGGGPTMPVRMIGLGQAAEVVADADVVVAAVAAGGRVLGPAELAPTGDRTGRPLLVVDLGMPRSVDPVAGTLPGITLIGMDRLDAAIARAMGERRAESDRARGIVAEEVARYRQAARARGAAPVIAALRGRLEELRRSEIERHRSKFGDLPAEAWESVDAVTRAVLAKMVHDPTVLLKETAGTPRGERLVEALRILFDL